MPLALFVIKDSVWSSVFVIFICSVWPILINTAFGVSSISRDLLNVAKTLELSPLRTALFVILPAASPTIVTGMRISIGIAWLVIVAAEISNIVRVLRSRRWQIAGPDGAAEVLGLHPNTLRSRMKRLGIPTRSDAVSGRGRS
jgi:ABC-type nitrate/sulfonate/bicarbonate transport system permease component